MRPCLEDFLQFAVQECGIDAKSDWREALAGGRELWRRLQTRAIVRDLQIEAAEVLSQLGWSVEAPVDEPVESERTLTMW